MKYRNAGLACLLCFLGAGAVPGQDAGSAVPAGLVGRGEFCFVWYNVENLFYPEDDSQDGDEEFTPEGPRRWTWSRYRAKLTSLAKVIIAAGRGKPPELLGLCEVESAAVLADLCAHPILAPYHYTYLHRDSRDHRGMDVSCLVREDLINTLCWETISFKDPVVGTRDIMHVCLAWGGDSLDIFMVHLLSRYGGAGATASLRRSQVEQLVLLMDSVYCSRQQGWVMAAGDFNEPYTGYSMHALRKARFGNDTLHVLLPGVGDGTYKYRGTWSHIDQVLVQERLVQFIAGVSCLQLPHLLMPDLQFGGTKPKRCYEGMQYGGGISDHLPLVLDLTVSLFSGPGVP